MRNVLRALASRSPRRLRSAWLARLQTSFLPVLLAWSCAACKRSPPTLWTCLLRWGRRANAPCCSPRSNAMPPCVSKRHLVSVVLRLRSRNLLRAEPLLPPCFPRCFLKWRDRMRATAPTLSLFPAPPSRRARPHQAHRLLSRSYRAARRRRPASLPSVLPPVACKRLLLPMPGSMRRVRVLNSTLWPTL